MQDKKMTEIDQLWKRHSKDELWRSVSEWWESANQARVQMLLAMHHSQGLSLPEIVEQAGSSETKVLQMLNELQAEGVVECRIGTPARFAVSDETAFIQHIQKCCERTAVAAGVIGTLAGWASESTST